MLKPYRFELDVWYRSDKLDLTVNIDMDLSGVIRIRPHTSKDYHETGGSYFILPNEVQSTADFIQACVDNFNRLVVVNNKLMKPILKKGKK